MEAIHQQILQPPERFTPRSFEWFPRLPVELRDKIWKLTLNERVGRVILPRLDCGPTSEISPRCCGQSYKIRPKIPALLHVCHHSRILARSVYIDIGLGGLFDSERDNILVFDQHAGNSRIYCPHHNCYMSSHLSGHGLEDVLKIPGVKNVVYYAQTRFRRSWLAHVKYLQALFLPREGGFLKETISVVTPERLLVVDWMQVTQAWTNHPDTSTTHLHQANNSIISRQVELLVDAL